MITPTVRSMYTYPIDGLVQDCSISIANALEILQACTNPSLCVNVCNV